MTVGVGNGVGSGRSRRLLPHYSGGVSVRSFDLPLVRMIHRSLRLPQSDIMSDAMYAYAGFQFN